ncbi:MAG: hypothetical protein A2X19_03205 [Bacteroidetes bacterium GWE2_39_28]|jgi:long-subunit fatty acid transport protein|nr:MAG: hypothetical protein A2X19_03205 [Bacteroidetes bacterium GWE2_39_28]OFY15592.1 MAG: hypothetical protein A2X16_04505 [Bacteroidetes bacterium GWF2_39_10]OFZ09276.1 MAG: hypothetical protein A2322_08745 [Bacteroidetes bacterium RIFOXYB2_FULL_39_7]OFZ11870.1 MAG: hypothetical protein A2465_06480 [Bacteroidetes bacterium RIFOXYC2_FULL_39_11]HCT94143.1 hypothetical protein [Rikenellaceae bacterium]
MKKSLLTISLMLLVIGASAQEQNKKNTGFRFSAQVGATFEVKPTHDDNSDKNMFSTNYRLGASYFLIPNVSVGVGVGIDKFRNPKTKALPLYIDAKYYLFNARNTPFIFGTAGILGAVNDYYQKGNMFDAGVGYKLFAGDKVCLTATAGYRHYTLKRVYLFEYDSKGIFFGLGIHF